MSDQVAEAGLRYLPDEVGSVVPEGYKQTEVGVIPEDWNLQELSEDVRLVSGHHVMAKYCNSTGAGVPYLTGPADFPNGQILVSKFTERPTSMCVCGDILITVKGSGAGSLVESNGTYCISRQLMSIQVREWNSKFLKFSIIQNAEAIKSAVTGLIPGLSRSDILDQKLPIPSLKEQTAIANALSDIDALISEQEKLIAKKQAIKTATMQQLLTGRTRLPQFALREDGSEKGYKQSELGEVPEDWCVTSIAENHHIATGNTPPTSDLENYGDEYMFASPADLSGKKGILKTGKMLSSKGYRFARKFPAGSTLFTCIGSTIGKTGYASVEMTSNQQINAVFPSNDSDPEYVFYMLTYLAPNVRILAGEQAVPLVNKTKFGETLCSFPKKKEEQTAIAIVLSDLDEGIQENLIRLTKTRQIKQGMMQELLTGKTRLLKPLNEDGAND